MRILGILAVLALPACVAVVQVDSTEECGSEATVFTPVTGITTASNCDEDQN